MKIEITPQFLASQGLSPTFPERFWPKINHDGPIPEHIPQIGKCWIWTGRLKWSGYGRMRKSNSDRNKEITAHVAAWILTMGPVPEGFHVLHHCDNRRCCRIWHMWLGTRADNIRDCIAKHRHPTVGAVGSDSIMSKLTEADVINIRARYNGVRGIETQLSKEYGVSIGMISMIVHRKSWTHI